MTDSRRAVSTTLGYVLMLAVASLLVVGLITAGSGFVSDQREEVIRGELEVLGQQLASDIMAADRMVESGVSNPSGVRIRQQRPDDVTGVPYRITLVDGSDPVLQLNTTQPSVAVTVELTTTTSLGQSSVNGGDVAVVYDTGANELVIERA
jgi:hypothetical protein